MRVLTKGRHLRPNQSAPPFRARAADEADMASAVASLEARTYGAPTRACPTPASAPGVKRGRGIFRFFEACIIIPRELRLGNFPLDSG